MNADQLQKKIVLVSASTIAVLAAQSPAWAAGLLPDAPPTLFNSVVNEFGAVTDIWIPRAMGWASAIFSALIVIEVSWSIVQAWLQHRDLDGFVHSLVHRIIYVGACIAILTFAPQIIRAAVTDFINIGTSIGGVSAPVDVDSIFRSGFQIAERMNNATRGYSWTNQLTILLPQIIGELLVITSYAIIAAQLLLTYIQVCITVAGGAFLLGFIGSRWTLPFAETYPKMLLQSGLKLVSIILILGLGNGLTAHWIALASANKIGALGFLSIGCGCILYAILAWSLPNLMQAFAGAAPAISASALVGSAARAVSSAVGGGGGGAPSSAPGRAMQTTIDPASKG